jgi:ubiquinone biosynthesis protein
MADMMRAVLEQDAHGCVQTLLSFTKAGEVESPEAFEHEISEYLAFEAQAIVASGQVGKAIDRLTNVLRRHEIQLAPRFTLLMKSLATIESTGHALDPNLDLVPILRPYVERIILERYAPANLLKEGRQHLLSVARLWAEIPTDVRVLLRMLRRGRLKITMDHEGLDHLTNVTDRASNRITFGLIAGSLVVGSSLLMFQGAGSWIIGASGFIGAGVLGIALLISILRSRNF